MDKPPTIRLDPACGSPDDFDGRAADQRLPCPPPKPGLYALLSRLLKWKDMETQP